MAKFKGFPQNVSVKHFITSKSVCTRIQEEGYDAYFVGGGVRDLLIGRSPKDFDIATNMPIAMVAAIFPSVGNNQINHKFFVHTFKHSSGVLVDVAQYRDDSTMNTRMGDVPTVGTLQSDAERRDFTINAIYLDPVTNMFLDPLGGAQDVLDKRLRTPADPTKTFKQDPVRLVRGLRFHYSFGFDMDFEFNAHKHLLQGEQSHVIRERILQEFTKIAKLPIFAARQITASQLINHFL